MTCSPQDATLAQKEKEARQVEDGLQGRLAAVQAELTEAQSQRESLKGSMEQVGGWEGGREGGRLRREGGREGGRPRREGGREAEERGREGGRPRKEGGREGGYTMPHRVE